jgi:CzcA family heavy metal efflux pump
MNPERHGRAIVLLTLLVAAAGALAATSLPSSIYPPLVFPRVMVIAHAGTIPGRSMMLTVTRPIEQALMEVPGMRRVRSRTFRGAAEISAQFDPAADMVVALQQVQSRIAEIRGSLPADTDIEAERLTPATFPIYAFNLSGGLSSAELRDNAFYVIRPALARVPGVGHVEVLASDEREIEVIVDPAKLLAARLTVDDVSDALKSTNQLSPIGRYSEDGIQHLILASGLWNDLSGIGDTPIPKVREDDKTTIAVHVRDVATVVTGSPDRTTLVVSNGGDSAAVTVSQQVGANILDVRRGVETALTDLGKSLPAGLHLNKTYDLAEFVAASIANVRDAILIGGFLAVLVLLLFLRNWRLTFVASVTLPLTVLATFLFMWLFGESINLMSMGGLAVAIGLVIDDAVVVVESIHRRIDEGAGTTAVAAATKELFKPVVGSTFTTVVVFAPLGMLSGVVGQFFRALSLTLSVAVLVSLVLAFTLIPLLARWLLVEKKTSSDVPAAPATNDTSADSLAAAEAHPTHTHPRKHSPLHPGSLPIAPAAAYLIALVLAIGAYFTYGLVGTGFLPAADEGGFVIDYLTPAGSSLEATDERMKKVEAILAQTPEIASYVRRTGSEMGMFATAQNTGDLLVRLKPRGDRGRSADEIINGLRDKLEEAVPDTEIEFVQLLQDMIGDLEGAPTPIEVKIFGDDVEVLSGLADDVEKKLEAMKDADGVVDVVGMEESGPEATWQVDAVAASRLGLTVEQVTDQLSHALLGNVATDLRLLDRTIPVRVRYPDSARFNPDALAHIPVRGANGTTVPANALVKAGDDVAQVELMRENLRQMALVTARLEGSDLGTAVGKIQTMMAGMKLPTGYTWEVGGQYQSQRQAFSELLLVFAIATTLVFVILVAEFRHFTPAVLILAAAPLSLSGAFLLLWMTGTDLNVSSAMGMILLVGLVVKNGIVLLDFAEHRRAEGATIDDAIAMAAETRLRPILMTTLCTLFGLLPLALGLGAGAELQKPLALAVIGGLTLSTAVTLYLVPAAYRGLSRKR